MKAQTPKGFRDFLPEDALRRQELSAKIIKTFEKFGFDPLETPTLEYFETLQGKYGEEEKLIYKFATPGGDEVALKYDQTVPLARVIAQYGPQGMQKITLPFKRYQIQSAYRGENTQKGRYREFLQCDADIIGVSTPLADAEVLSLAYEIFKNIGLEVIIKINDRNLLRGFEPKHLSAIDKLNKIGEQGVIDELVQKGLSGTDAAQALNKIRGLTTSQNLDDIIRLFTQLGHPAEALTFDPTLVRGLDYYTGLIFEVVLKDNPNNSSLCGGGRWDTMIGKFTGTDQPAVGFAIGFDRTLEAMDEKNLLKGKSTNTKILVTYFSSESLEDALKLTASLRQAQINCEIWLNPETKAVKQIKYADYKGIPYLVIVGLEETGKNEVVLKDLNARQQESVTPEHLIQIFKSPTQ